MDAGFPTIPLVQAHDDSLPTAQSSPALEDKIPHLLSSNLEMRDRIDQLKQELKDLCTNRFTPSSSTRKKSYGRHRNCF